MEERAMTMQRYLLAYNCTIVDRRDNIAYIDHAHMFDVTQADNTLSLATRDTHTSSSQLRSHSDLVARSPVVRGHGRLPAVESGCCVASAPTTERARRGEDATTDAMATPRTRGVGLPRVARASRSVSRRAIDAHTLYVLERPLPLRRCTALGRSAEGGWPRRLESRLERLGRLGDAVRQREFDGLAVELLDRRTLALRR